MTYDPDRHHRHSIRLRGYDYAQAGAYFVTICAQDRACLFGEEVDGEVRLSGAGEIVHTVWDDLMRWFPGIDLDAFVIMPNHVHGIVFLGTVPDADDESDTPFRAEGAMNRAPTNASYLPREERSETVDPCRTGASRRVGARFIAPSSPISRPRVSTQASPNRRPSPTLGEVVRSFKAVSTRQIRLTGDASFAWQRYYYERIIRSDRELERARVYIAENPGRWADDAEHPSTRRPPEPPNVQDRSPSVDLTSIAADRLDLPPLTAAAIQALIDGDGERLEALTGAVFPLPVVAPPEMADALPFLRDRVAEEPADAPWWARLLVRRETREAVGSAGFGGRPDTAGTTVVGYSVYPEFQGHGYATEAVRALVGWALAQPGVARVRATIPPWNAPSLRVAEKAGLRRVGTAVDEEAGEVEVWEIGAALVPVGERGPTA